MRGGYVLARTIVEIRVPGRWKLYPKPWRGGREEQTFQEPEIVPHGWNKRLARGFKPR